VVSWPRSQKTIDLSSLKKTVFISSRNKKNILDAFVVFYSFNINAICAKKNYLICAIILLYGHLLMSASHRYMKCSTSRLINTSSYRYIISTSSIPVHCYSFEWIIRPLIILVVLSFIVLVNS
jgi:hypothetical protein